MRVILNLITAAAIVGLAFLAFAFAQSLGVDAGYTAYRARMMGKGTAIAVVVGLGILWILLVIRNAWMSGGSADAELYRQMRARNGRIGTEQQPITYADVRAAEARRLQELHRAQMVPQPRRYAEPVGPEDQMQDFGYTERWIEDTDGTPLVWDNEDNIIYHVHQRGRQRVFRIPAWAAEDIMLLHFWYRLAVRPDTISRALIADQLSLISRDRYAQLMALVSTPQPHGLGFIRWNDPARPQSGFQVDDFGLLTVFARMIADEFNLQPTDLDITGE